MKNKTRWAFALIGLMALLLAGCQTQPEEGRTDKAVPVSAETLPIGQVITLGHNDPNEPAQKVNQVQPLADYLAAHLEGFGIRGGQVVITQTTDEMTRLLVDGAVDIYFDATFPSSDVCRLAGCQPILQQWKRGQPTFYGVFIARQDAGITSIDDLRGKVIAFQKPRSTVGYRLPAATLMQRGFTLTSVSHPDSAVAPGEIGYINSSGERTSVELLLTGQVAAVAFGDITYNELPEEIKEQLVIFDRTASILRYLVSARPGLNPELANKISELLMGLDQTEEGRLILDSLRDTEKFETLSEESAASLRAIEDLAELVPGS